MPSKYIHKEYREGGYYHIYNRGNNKKKIFLDKDDYLFYLKKMREFKEGQKVSVICYCLMPNHLHLVLRQDSKAPLYKFILSLHTSYSMYYNKKYNQAGHLFQGRFKQKNIDKNEYLLQLSSYVHLNPLVGGLVARVEDYWWSSYPDYINARGGTLCDKNPVLLGLSAGEYKEVVERDGGEQLDGKNFAKKLKNWKWD